MTSDLERSFKAKLRAIAKEKKRDPADLWQSLSLERFLVRLARSEHRNHFVLKGGILLSKYIEIGRETADLDFLARKIGNDATKLKQVFEQIALMDLQDGFIFKEIKVSKLAHSHMKYSGAEVEMMAYFGKTRFKVGIDIGFGDVVEPVDFSIPLIRSSKGDLFEGSITLSCYPKEFIFAEKLETIVYRGSFNSRMKDFHDLYYMIATPSALSFSNLEKIIRQVFEHRETSLVLPLTYDGEGMERLQNYWSEHLSNLGSENTEHLPASIAQVITSVNDWLRLNTNVIQQTTVQHKQ